MGAVYLDGLAVVDFDHVEVETVNPFTRRDEVAPLFVEIPAHVHENLREKERQLKKRLNYTLIKASAVNQLEHLSERRRQVEFWLRPVVFGRAFLAESRACFCLNGLFPSKL